MSNHSSQLLFFVMAAGKRADFMVREEELAPQLPQHQSQYLANCETADRCWLM